LGAPEYAVAAAPQCQGEATKAGCMAATGHARRPQSPDASAPPNAGSGGGKAGAVAPGGKPATANCDAARVAVGVAPFAPMVTWQLMPRRGRARKAAHVATAAPPGVRSAASGGGCWRRAGGFVSGTGWSGCVRRLAPTLVDRWDGGRGGGAAGVKSVGDGSSGPAAASVAMQLVPSASARRSEKVVAPQRRQQQPA